MEFGLAANGNAIDMSTPITDLTLDWLSSHLRPQANYGTVRPENAAAVLLFVTGTNM